MVVVVVCVCVCVCVCVLGGGVKDRAGQKFRRTNVCRAYAQVLRKDHTGGADHTASGLPKSSAVGTAKQTIPTCRSRLAVEGNRYFTPYSPSLRPPTTNMRPSKRAIQRMLDRRAGCACAASRWRSPFVSRPFR